MALSEIGCEYIRKVLDRSLNTFLVIGTDEAEIARISVDITEGIAETQNEEGCAIDVAGVGNRGAHIRRKRSSATFF